MIFAGADIEEVTDDMLEKMIVKEDKLAVLFYEENEPQSVKALDMLETIDDDLDEMGVLMVKINEPSVATDFGIDTRPTLVIFEKGIPNVYEGTKSILGRKRGFFYLGSPSTHFLFFFASLIFHFPRKLNKL